MNHFTCDAIEFDCKENKSGKTKLSEAGLRTCLAAAYCGLGIGYMTNSQLAGIESIKEKSYHKYVKYIRKTHIVLADDSMLKVINDLTYLNKKKKDEILIIPMASDGHWITR